MNSELVDTLLITRQDFLDSIRSRRLIVWLLLYLSVAIASTFLFCRVLYKVEQQFTEAISVEPSSKTGQVTTTIQQSKSFEKIIGSLIDDKDMVRQLLTLHPLVIFYAWFSFSFMPLLVIIISSDTIARDVSTRFVRFSLFRTSRSAYAIGKAICSALILLAALTVSALATLAVGAFQMQPFNAFDNLPYILMFVLKCWIYNLAFLGVALMASQLRQSPLKAQFLALLTYLFLIILHPIAAMKTGSGLARLWQIGILISPSSYIIDLWHPSLYNNMKASIYCLGLSFLFFFIGFISFARRDL